MAAKWVPRTTAPANATVSTWDTVPVGEDWAARRESGDLKFDALAGGLVSTIGDYQKFAKFLLRNGRNANNEYLVRPSFMKFALSLDAKRWNSADAQDRYTPYVSSVDMNDHAWGPLGTAGGGVYQYLAADDDLRYKVANIKGPVPPNTRNDPNHILSLDANGWGGAFGTFFAVDDVEGVSWIVISHTDGGSGKLGDAMASDRFDSRVWEYYK
jgi:CubicO group peptidase (beta-lactamase class C family)